MPVYNSERCILRSVKSVLNQTFRNFELIVVDDCSTDSSLCLVKSFNDSRIRIISKPNNSGVSSSRNIGIKSANGDYICFLDSDDEYYPNHLQVLLEAINKYPYVYSLTTMNSTLLLSGKLVTPKCDQSFYLSKNPVKDVLINRIKVWTGCMCIKSIAFREYGFFCEGIKHGEDRDMWERVYVHRPIVYVKQVTVQRNRDASEATKIFDRNWTEIDKKERLDQYLADPTISDQTKESLITSYEWFRLSNVRTLLLNGNKAKAFEEYKNIDKKRLPVKRKVSTFFCFFVPSSILRRIMKKRNEGYYQC